MKIDWSSSYRSDGTRRKPPPNTLHGWLAKMRGTILGDEQLRSKGMMEMADAKRYKDNRRRMDRSSGNSGFDAFSSKESKLSKRPTQRLTRDERSDSYLSKKSHRSSSNTRPRPKHRSSQSSARTMPGAYPAPRPSTQRRASTKR